MGYLGKFMVRWANIVRSSKDDKQVPVQQVTYMGKVADCLMVYPYGFHANASDESLTLMFSVGGSAENRAGIPTSMNKRPQLAGGEVAVYNPVTSSSITFTADGGVTTGATTHTMNCDVTVTGVVDATSYSVGGSAGASGTFTTADAKTVTVTNGIITSIV